MWFIWFFWFFFDFFGKSATNYVVKITLGYLNLPISTPEFQVKVTPGYKTCWFFFLIGFCKLWVKNILHFPPISWAFFLKGHLLLLVISFFYVNTWQKNGVFPKVLIIGRIQLIMFFFTMCFNDCAFFPIFFSSLFRCNFFKTLLCE